MSSDTKQFPRDWKMKSSVPLSEISDSSMQLLDRIWDVIQQFDLNKIHISVEAYPDYEIDTDLEVVFTPSNRKACRLSFVKFRNSPNQTHVVAVGSYNNLTALTGLKMKKYKLPDRGLLGYNDFGPASTDIRLIEQILAVATGRIDLQVGIWKSRLIYTEGAIIGTTERFELEGWGGGLLRNLLSKVGSMKVVDVHYEPWSLV